ncbi:MAG: endonuclease/exonuclease/phosphatase family protein [bacterium]
MAVPLEAPVQDSAPPTFTQRAGAAWRAMTGDQRLALALILFLILRILPQRPIVIELAANFLAWALLPAPLVWVVAAIRRDWPRVAWWTIPALAFCLLFGELFVPSINRPIPSQGQHLRVMTFNLFGVPRVGDRQPEIDFIRESGADLVALEELSGDAAKQIDLQLATVYPYRDLHPQDVYGVGLLSKHPLLESEISQYTEGTFHVNARVDIEGTPITVLVAHPPPPLDSLLPKRLRHYTPRGGREIAALLAHAPKDSPVLLLGDFNCSDQARDYQQPRQAGLHDTFREVGWGFGTTWPCRLKSILTFPPLIRIDYIWHSDQFQAVKCWVGPQRVSDHRPLVAELVLSDR